MEWSNLRVRGDRLRDSLEQMARIGGTPGGGMHRLTLTDEDKQARDLFIRWLRELDLEITVDRMGNIFGRRAGLRNDLPPVMCGSHLDTQPQGGRFDGILGVMGALEVMRTLIENRVETPRPLVIVDWTNEEGSRFSPAMVGSGVWAGKLDLDWVYSRTDVGGKKFGEELERIGYKGAAPAARWPVRAYFEYHIEQGPQLEREGKTIGAPEGIICLHWYDVFVQGTANQVGPTPMEGRNDALCAAAEMILKVNEVPSRLGGNLVATVGEIHNHPNSRNIIPGGVHFTVDIRSWNDDLALKAWEELEKDFRAVAEKRGCGLRQEVTWRVGHVPFDPNLVERVEETAQELGFSYKRMVSGAGHDASYMGLVSPTAMIFVPSVGGRSHVEVENTSWADCTAGANVLLHCLLKTLMEA
ncbi:MAG: M20 family metallo-hydrolase [Thermodesulfobacteriota bacterium]